MTIVDRDVQLENAKRKPVKTDSGEFTWVAPGDALEIDLKGGTETVYEPDGDATYDGLPATTRTTIE